MPRSIEFCDVLRGHQEGVCKRAHRRDPATLNTELAPAAPVRSPVMRLRARRDVDERRQLRIGGNGRFQGHVIDAARSAAFKIPAKADGAARGVRHKLGEGVCHQNAFDFPAASRYHGFLFTSKDENPSGGHVGRRLDG